MNNEMDVMNTQGSFVSLSTEMREKELLKIAKEWAGNPELLNMVKQYSKEVAGRQSMGGAMHKESVGGSMDAGGDEQG